MYLTVCPLHSLGLVSGCGGISKEYSLTDHTLPTRSEPFWQNIAQSPFNSTTQPVDIKL